MKCEKCGAELEPNVTFCNKCGAAVGSSSSTGVETSPAPKKKGLKIVLIILLLLIFLGAGIGIGMLINKGGDKCDVRATPLKDDKEDKEEKEEEPDKKEEKEKPGENKHLAIDISKIKSSGEDELGKNIEILKYYYGEKGNDLYVLAKNNNTVSVDYTFYLNYLDKKGSRVDRKLSMGYVDPGKTFVVRIYNSTNDEYDSVSVTVSAKKYKSYYHSVDVSKKVEVKDSSDGVVVSYKNDTDKDVSIYMSIIYYKNNEIVYFNSATISAKVGLSENSTFYSYNIPGYDYNKNTSELYDRYEVSVDAGFSYDTDY